MKCEHNRQTADVVDAYVCDDCGATTVTILRAKLAAAEKRAMEAELAAKNAEAFIQAADARAERMAKEVMWAAKALRLLGYTVDADKLDAAGRSADGARAP